MNICEYCKNEHDGCYGSGRFCNNICARGFSTKSKRIEINQKVSVKLKEKKSKLTNQQKIQRKIAKKHASYIRDTEIITLFDLSKRTVSKILKRLNLPCSLCGWFVEGVVCDVHHIVEKKIGGSDNHDNLTYVCPNCHRLIHSNLIDINELVNLSDYIGDKWKEYYYVKNGKLQNK